MDLGSRIYIWNELDRDPGFFLLARRILRKGHLAFIRQSPSQSAAAVAASKQHPLIVDQLLARAHHRAKAGA